MNDVALKCTTITTIQMDLASVLKAIGTQAVVFIGGLLLGVSKASQHVIERWWDAREERLKHDRASRPPRRTLLVAEDESLTSPILFPVDQYEGASATGLRVTLMITLLGNRSIRVTSTTVRLPLTRRKHRVVDSRLDRVDFPVDLLRGASFAVAMNCYVQPPFSNDKPIRAVIRIRDQFLNWHERKVTFKPIQQAGH